MDVYDFCNKKIKESIEKYRKKKLEKEDKEREKKQAINNSDKEKDKEKDKMDVDEEKAEKEETISSLFSGYYELCGIVTHKGRSANSGHYIGYAKDIKRNKWLKYDDEDVTEIKSDDIKQLYGGGDFQMGVQILYRRVETNDL